MSHTKMAEPVKMLFGYKLVCDQEIMYDMGDPRPT